MISRLYSRRRKACSRVEYIRKSNTHSCFSDRRGGILSGVVVEHAATQSWHHTTLIKYLNRRTRKRHLITTRAHYFLPQTNVLPRHYSCVKLLFIIIIFLILLFILLYLLFIAFKIIYTVNFISIMFI